MIIYKSSLFDKNILYLRINVKLIAYKKDIDGKIKQRAQTKFVFSSSYLFQSQSI